jgi:hypothetical protein
MNDITKSASKLVLLYIIGLLGVLSLAAGLFSIFTQTFGEAAKVIITAFVGAVTFLLGYYFGAKGDTTQPYGGK